MTADYSRENDFKIDSNDNIETVAKSESTDQSSTGETENIILNVTISFKLCQEI